jgi:hypothetical protein
MRVWTVILCIALFSSCGSASVVSQKDITEHAQWLESSTDNPIINVVQRVYSNDDVEIVIKKKLTTDYVKITLRNDRKVINKKTVKTSNTNI